MHHVMMACIPTSYSMFSQVTADLPMGFLTCYTPKGHMHSVSVCYCCCFSDAVLCLWTANIKLCLRTHMSAYTHIHARTHAHTPDNRKQIHNTYRFKLLSDGCCLLANIFLEPMVISKLTEKKYHHIKVNISTNGYLTQYRDG